MLASGSRSPRGCGRSCPSERGRTTRNRSASRGVPTDMWEECIRCNEAPAVDEQGYCGHCHWAVRAEVEEGFYALREYLRAWARFDEWCEARGIAV